MAPESLSLRCKVGALHFLPRCGYSRLAISQNERLTPSLHAPSLTLSDAFCPLVSLYNI
jgi:hypothetical protein